MRRLPVTLVCAVFAAFLFADFADAQLFRRNIQRTRTVQSGCPGGVCPTATATRQAIVSRSSGHWTHPGTIDGHLQSAHAAQLAQAGISISGMTREQMLDTHDALHEGRSVKTFRAAAVTQPAKSTQSVKVQPTTAPKAVPVASECTFGLGEVSILEPKVSIPSHVLAQVDDKPKAVAEDPFRKSLTKAIADSRKKGTINFRDAVKLRVAMMSPAFVEKAKELAVTQVAFSGIESPDVPMDADGVIQVEGINWEVLAAFLEKLMPLILALLKAFGV
jgi:hypothetical protein